LFLAQEQGPDTDALVHVPAVSEWSDFDDRHGKNCIFLQSTLSVRLNMSEQNNGQPLSHAQDAKPRYTGEILLRTRPAIYRRVVQLLSENTPVIQIMRLCRVAQDTVIAVRNREAQTISERKNKLATMLSDVATLGTERMTHTISKANLRDAAIGTGIAVDKMLALTGQSPVGVQVAVVNMPTPEEREERQRAHDALDEITRLLHAPKPLSPEDQLLLKVELEKLKLTGPRHAANNDAQSAQGGTAPSL
jgi:hypothetical protein